jgi:hypothetical protein
MALVELVVATCAGTLTRQLGRFFSYYQPCAAWLPRQPRLKSEEASDGLAGVSHCVPEMPTANSNSGACTSSGCKSGFRFSFGAQCLKVSIIHLGAGGR